MHRTPTIAPVASWDGASQAAWDAVLALPFGRLGVRCSAERLIELAYLPAATPPRAAGAPQAALVGELRAQLLAYCADPDHRFTLPLAERGSVFQRRVWDLMREIPRGSVLRYGDAAQRLGSAARAIGGACRANPFAPIVPCHRIVAAAGLGGFAGSRGDDALAIKAWLLHHEGVDVGAH
ncbi:methylated-DNA--protein-cysteine methyltransferase [mine drainage metagenome]|uniref:Methylated-DNA--protein-cysteine methyltransferase n=1 Tax=mine drainage metagenome TaxID=410659 RepID=A0A1J5Q988_9ZZZZ